MTTALADLRKLNHLSQEELAAKTGLTAKTINTYEKDVNNLRKARYENIEKIAKTLKVTVDDIFLEDTSVFLKRIIERAS
ncbi:helix-turn-helix transcriptional regulator [Lactococcus ileimucosae]|uniref:Helix-turn-helix transcriptional regulator n=1 Tax=Lactococcus ileimucosae TaxID=2941329 RepID=A0ABV4D190_9LACT